MQCQSIVTNHLLLLRVSWVAAGRTWRARETTGRTRFSIGLDQVSKNHPFPREAAVVTHWLLLIFKYLLGKFQSRCHGTGACCSPASPSLFSPGEYDGTRLSRLAEVVEWSGIGWLEVRLATLEGSSLPPWQLGGTSPTGQGAGAEPWGGRWPDARR